MRRRMSVCLACLLMLIGVTLAGADSPGQHATMAWSSFHDTSWGGRDEGIVASVEQFGALSITLEPPAAIAAGAQWRRVETTAWLNSGATETGLVPGNYTVEFNTVTDWNKPSNKSVTISGGQETRLSADYIAVQSKLNWSTYIGGWGGEVSYDIAVDAAGFVYTCGWTTAADWVSGGFDTSHNGADDAFVVKLTPAGQHVWSTYLGGSGMDQANAIAVDGPGNVSVAGESDAGGWVTGGHDTTHNGDMDAFVVRLTPAGQFDWGTFLGGSGADEARSLVVDGSNNIVVAGLTKSSGWVANAWDGSFGGDSDAFAVKLSPTGQHLWSTYLGGGLDDYAAGITIDGDGNCFLCGTTITPGWISGGYKTEPDRYDAFVVKLSAGGMHLWSTYVGGTDNEYGNGVALDPSGNVLLTGETRSPDWVHGGYLTRYGGGGDAFVSKLSGQGQLIWSTYLGGANFDESNGVATDGEGNVFATGRTHSAGWTANGLDTTYQGLNGNGFAVKLTPDGRHWWSTYLGGTDQDIGYRIAVDQAHNVYVAGSAGSPGWVSGGYNTILIYNDGFIASIHDTNLPLTNGSLRVLITPAAAVAAGAKWRRVGTTAWRDGGTSETGLWPGYHTVEFQSVAGWVIPAPLTTWIGNAASVQLTGQYVQAGTLRVTISPAAAVAAGAKWRRVGTTAWLDSGASDLSAPPGSVAIEFKALPLWTAPATQNTTVTPEQSTDLSATYTARMTELAWSTYIGGAYNDDASDIIVDGSGNLFVTGSCYGDNWVQGGYDTTNNGSFDAYLVKISPSGQHSWSTFYGGTSDDYGSALALDPSGNIYLTGNTKSAGWLKNGFDTTYSGDSDDFIIKLSSAGTPLWGAYLGGINLEYAGRVALDPSGNIFVSGVTASPGWLSGGFDSSYAASTDLFLVKLSPVGQRLWGTYAGDNGAESNPALGVDAAGNAYLAGTTSQATWIPEALNAPRGDYEGFALKFAPAGQLLWGTWLGGSAADTVSSLVAAPSGMLYVAGETNSASWLPGGHDTTLGGTADAFLLVLSPDGQQRWGTYVGGADRDSAQAISLEPTGCIIMTGSTSSSEWLSGGFDTIRTVPSNYASYFVTQISPWGQMIWGSYISQFTSDRLKCHAVAPDGCIYLLGRTVDSPWIQGGYDTTWNGGWDAFVAKIVQNAALSVLISPPEAASAGAQWRRVGTTVWHRSGELDCGLSAGDCQVEFNAPPGYNPPPTRNVTILASQTVVTSGTCIGVGSLRVVLSPAAAVAAGAKWRRTGTSTWLDSARLETNIPAGPCKIEFKPVTGWKTPAPYSTMVYFGEENLVNVPYREIRNSVAQDDWMKY